MPLGFHKKAKDAAYAGAAAHKQGKFWEIYNFLFSKQKEWNKSVNFKEWLETHKAEIPVDWEQFKKDMESKGIETLVAEDIKAATALGLRGTPASFINGRFISGALPIDSFKKVIDEELKKAEGKGSKGNELYLEIIKNGKPAVAKKNGNKTEEDPNKIYSVKLTGKEAAKGSKNPKVTIIEFSDFQCPFCSKAFKTVEAVAGKYKNDVRIVYKNLPLSFHKEAKPAALFAHAVKNLYGDEKFFQLASILYAKQNEWKTNSEEKFAAYAKEIGADWEKVKAEAAKPETEAAVSEDIREAGSHNIRGVPVFFVNGKKVGGAKPAEFFESMIESIIKEKK